MSNIGFYVYYSVLGPSSVFVTLDSCVSTGYVNVSPRGKGYEVRLRVQ
jgi:hypothetical protein